MRAQAYAKAIWQRLLKEYVPSLNKRSKWYADSNRDLRTGDLVWIVNPSSPRGHYPLGQVTALHYGKDNVARSRTVKTLSSQLVRSFVKLALVLTSSGGEDVAELVVNKEQV